MTFGQSVQAHLSGYKRTVLGLAENGNWRGKSYAHILSYDLNELNILPSIRERFWSDLPGMKIKLHRDFHHLNSSQAVAFNLFYPAMVGLDAGMLLTRVGIHGAREEFCFEKVLDEKRPG